MSDSESEDQQLIRQTRYRRRERKRRRDKAFQRRQSASSSDSEPDPMRRRQLAQSDTSAESDGQQPRQGDDGTDRSNDFNDSDLEGHVVNFDGVECERQEEEIEEGRGGEEEEEERHEDQDDEGEGDEEQERASEVDGESEAGASESGDESQQESNSDSSEEENFDINDNQPLYAGAQITLKQSALSILSFALSHNLSKVCIDDLLSLITLHCGQNNNCLKSVHLFKKYFSMLGQDHVTRHYYCSNCEIPLPSKDSVCPSCAAHDNANDEVDDPDNGHDNERKYDVQYFIELSMTKQLQTMFKRPGFAESLQFKFNRVKRNAHNIEDLYDGQIYNELERDGFLSNPNNISFTMYFDGVALYKSGKFSIWPIYLSINELKYKQRVQKENIIIAGLWFGKTKPNPNLFLKPLWDKMEVLQNQGVELTLPNGQLRRVRGRVISAVGDLPAKALFMRLIQFNGLYSCFNCMSKGARYGTGRRSSVQVYPYSRNFRLRNKEEMVEFANQAVIARRTDPKAAIYGVKGPTLLSAFLPDLVRCMGIDDLHGLFSGLMKAQLELWFQCEGEFSISALVDLVDERLKAIKPPFHFQRVPRSIRQELGLFKGSDFKYMLFFYSVPVLYGILPDVYWEHHCKLVSAVSLLSQDSVSPDQIQTADELLHMYVRDFQRLYGIRHLGLNVHQLLHLSMVVRNLGPLWAYSCFTYESLNGQLSSLVHGTRYAALQVCSSSFVCLNLSVMVGKMEDCEAKRLCSKFAERGRKKVRVSEIIDCVTTVVDDCKVRRVPQWITRLLENDLNIIGGRIKFFLRLKKKGSVYCSEEYVRSKRKLSCFVEVFQNNVPYLCKIKFFIRWSSCNPNCPMNCLQCPTRFLSIVETYERIPWRLQALGNDISIPHLNKVNPTGVFSAFPVSSFRNACLYISINEDQYLCTPVNSLEVE